MKNTIASIQHQLKELAVADGKAYQLILTRYFQKRLLFRLAASAYSAQFCLKGGPLLYALEQEKSRPTLDIDLLTVSLSRQTEQRPQIFAQISGLDYPPDGVVFDAATLKGEPIKKAGPYPGGRLKLL
ncbi:nucleotidyl transferase AbiEii/AbiGii toxin family protein, partial [Fibrella forsythiae]